VHPKTRTLRTLGQPRSVSIEQLVLNLLSPIFLPSNLSTNVTSHCTSTARGEPQNSTYVFIPVTRNQLCFRDRKISTDNCVAFEFSEDNSTAPLPSFLSALQRPHRYELIEYNQKVQLLQDRPVSL
jgi:hypothetical protein